MKLNCVLALASMCGAIGAVTQAAAQECCAPVACPLPVAVECPAPPVVQQYALQEHTVMVPQSVMRRQKMQVQSFQTVQRPKVATVYEQVPEVVNIPTQQATTVNQVVMQSQTQMMLQPFYRDVPYQYQAQVVENQLMDQTFEVTKNVPRMVKYKVTNQKVQTIHIPGQAPVTKAVGCPTTQCETHREMAQVKQLVTEQRMVPVAKSVTQTGSYRVLEYHQVPQTVQVPTMVAVPQIQTVNRQVVQYRSVPRTITTMESVQVPVMIDQEYDIPAIEYVPMKLQSYVPIQR